METEYARPEKAKGDHCFFGLFGLGFWVFWVLFYFRKLQICYYRFRNVGEEAEDGSEVDKLVLKGKDRRGPKEPLF